MFFTEEDYRKIEKWLVSKGVMDTQFSPAAPLDGNETVAIVQNGKNVNATIDALVEKLFLLGVDDFLNVTDKYEQPAIPLIQAISLIPFRHRKIGQVITFLNEDNKWVIYQFQGSSLTQWNNPTQWVNVIGSAITGELVPDEEDLTGIKEGDNTVLKFKNKAYSTANFSGLGRVYLRKNIAGGRNILTQQMINQENTRYILQYDYDLNGQTITIPNNCVIEFEGGSISNGNLILDNTSIEGTDNLFKELSITGSISGDLMARWFGFTDSGVDNINSLIQLFSTANNTNSKVNFEGISKVPLRIPLSYTTIQLNTSVDFKDSIFIIENNSIDTFLFSIDNSNKSSVITIDKTLLTESNTVFTSTSMGSKTGLLMVNDLNVWTYRNGTEPQNRRDLLSIINGKSENSVIATYNNEASNPQCTFVELPIQNIEISNIKVIRANSSKITKFISLSYVNNITFNNIQIDTILDSNSPNSEDSIFSVYYSANISLNDIKVLNTYSSTLYGYAFLFDTCYNISFSNIIATSDYWGVFGCNKLNKVSLDNCDINRFDIHCYGKDILITNSVIRDLYNQYSSIYGYIKYENCRFYDSYVCLYDSSYNAYTKHRVVLNNCEIFNSKQSTISLFVMGDFLVTQNARPELGIKYLPEVQINNTIIHTEYNVSLMSFSSTTPTVNSCKMSGPIEISNTSIDKSVTSNSVFRVLDTLTTVDDEVNLSFKNCNFTSYKDESNIVINSAANIVKDGIIGNFKSTYGISFNFDGGIYQFVVTNPMDNVIFNMSNCAITNFRYLSTGNNKWNIVNSKIYLTCIDDGTNAYLDTNIDFVGCKFVTFNNLQRIRIINKANYTTFKNCTTNVSDAHFILYSNNDITIDPSSSAGKEMLSKELENKVIYISRNLIYEYAHYYFKPILTSEVKRYVWWNFSYNYPEIWDGSLWRNDDQTLVDKVVII